MKLRSNNHGCELNRMPVINDSFKDKNWQELQKKLIQTLTIKYTTENKQNVTMDPRNC